MKAAVVKSAEENFLDFIFPERVLYRNKIIQFPLNRVRIVQEDPEPPEHDCCA